MLHKSQGGYPYRMKDFFSIGEAAKAAGTTAETLRHYDRIGLVKPGKKDEWTSWRYYTKQDIVCVRTVRALQRMGLPLQKIKEVLAYDDLEKIIAFLSDAEKEAGEKIAAIEQSRQIILAAKQDYEGKLHGYSGITGYKIVDLPARVLVLSDSLSKPTLENLWNYLSHFYGMLPQAVRDQFQFEDLAGVYTSGGKSQMFAVCTHYTEISGLKILPAGRYLCAECAEEDRQETIRQLLQIGQKEYQSIADFTVEQIIVSGILQWKYQIQIYLDETVQHESENKKEEGR